MKTYQTIIMIMFIKIHGVLGQGFVNMDFESANLSGYSAGSVPTSNAIPGWTAYIGGMTLANINYNIGIGGGIQVSVIGTNAFQGNYCVLLQGEVSTSVNEPASIGQTGTIPGTAQSLIFWGFGPGVVSFNGQILPLTVLSYTANYDILGINISPYAGQTGQLLFTSTHYGVSTGFSIDNIQFSSSPIPEPGIVSLFALGSLGFLWQRQKAKTL